MAEDGGRGAEEPAPKDPALSYRYWVGGRGDAAPPPQPKKLTQEEAASMHRNNSQGSLWNQGGTWEERSLNDWAKARMKELMRVTKAVDMYGVRYKLTTDLDSLSGDTTIVVVRNKKKHGYMLDIALKLKGRAEQDEGRVLEGTMRISEATFGDVDSIHVEVSLDAGKSGFSEETKGSVESFLSSHFLPALQEKLQDFENELVQR